MLTATADYIIPFNLTNIGLWVGNLILLKTYEGPIGNEMLLIGHSSNKEVICLEA
jgi:hypothetical protein